MKQNFTVRQGALDGVVAFLSVVQHRNFRKAAAELGVTNPAERVRARIGRRLAASGPPAGEADVPPMAWVGRIRNGR
jgi:hypothetical protein